MTIEVKKDNYRGAVAITPNDSADLTDSVSALHISVAGALKVDMLSGETVTFASVPVGTIAIAVSKVYATGTAATGIVGLK
jgi:hypothetical protein